MTDHVQAAVEAKTTAVWTYDGAGNITAQGTHMLLNQTLFVLAHALDGVDENTLLELVNENWEKPFVLRIERTIDGDNARLACTVDDDADIAAPAAITTMFISEMISESE